MLWREANGARNDLYVSRYSIATNGWTATKLSGAGNGNVTGFVQDLNNGNLLTAWTQFNGAYVNVYAARYSTAANAWSAATRIDAAVGGDASVYSVAQDASGSAVVVGTQWSGAYNDLFARRYDRAAGTWGANAVLASSSSGSATPRRSIADAMGNVFLLWSQPNLYNAKVGLYASRYDVSTGMWGPTANLAPNVGTDVTYGAVTSPSLFVAPLNSTSVFAWELYDGFQWFVTTYR